jgi:hypothetical protein
VSVGGGVGGRAVEGGGLICRRLWRHKANSMSRRPNAAIRSQHKCVDKRQASFTGTSFTGMSHPKGRRLAITTSAWACFACWDGIPRSQDGIGLTGKGGWGVC